MGGAGGGVVCRAGGGVVGGACTPWLYCRWELTRRGLITD